MEVWKLSSSSVSTVPGTYNLQSRGRSLALISAAPREEQGPESRLSHSRRMKGKEPLKGRWKKAGRAPAYNNWIFHALPNEPIKIQPIWFADRNFAFKIFELFPSFSLFRAEVISKESGAGRRWGVHLSASFPSGSVTVGDFA